MTARHPQSNGAHNFRIVGTIRNETELQDLDWQPLESQLLAATAYAAQRRQLYLRFHSGEVYRVGNTSFPAQVNGKTLAAAWTFTDVLYSTVPGVQFEAITGPAEKTVKFNNSAPGNYQSLSKAECADLAGSIDAIRGLMLNGPKYGFTTFRGYDPNNGKAVKIGGSYFWTEP